MQERGIGAKATAVVPEEARKGRRKSRAARSHTESAGERPQRRPGGPRSVWLWGAVLFLVTVWAYWPAVHAGFVWDDDDYVTHNRNLRSFEGLARIWFVPRSLPQYYPLVHTTYWLEYRLWGLEATGYHVTNIVLHAANAVLVWRILCGLQVPAALFAATLFALHPVQVESVAWVTERKNTLSGLFFFTAAWLYLNQSRARGRYWASFASYVAALLSKTVTATLPVVLLVIEWARHRASARTVACLLPFLACGAALATVTIVLEREHVGAVGPDWDLSFLQRTLIASRALWFYLTCLAYPVNLAFIYPRWHIEAANPAAYVPLLGCVAVGLVLWLGVRWWGRWPLAAALYFAVTLGPALGFVNVFPMRYSFVADHFQYLGTVGPLALAAATAALGARRLESRWGVEAASRAAFAGAVAVSMTLALLTREQCRAYENAETLWRDTLRKNPAAWMAHNNLGLLLLQRGEATAAETHFRAALEAKPDDSFAMNNLGLVEAQRGRMQEAIAWFERAVRVDPTHAEAANNWGNAWVEMGDLAAAEAAFREAIRRKRDYADAWNNLANVLALRGDNPEAERAYERAVALDPEYTVARLNYVRFLLGRGESARARQELRAILAREPGNQAALALLQSIADPGRDPGAGPPVP